MQSSKKRSPSPSFDENTRTVQPPKPTNTPTSITMAASVEFTPPQPPAPTPIVAPPATTVDPSQIDFPLPKPLQYASAHPPQLITQGAEGRVYRSTYLTPDLPCVVKYRPPKAYRHPTLDRRLTRQRILAEARILLKCLREGVSVPAVYAVDEVNGCMYLEFIEGEPVRARVNRILAQHLADGKSEEEKDFTLLKRLMTMVGESIGRLHRIGIVHGDLTTSNMMLQALPEDNTGPVELGGIVVIDFGLASQSTLDEDRAVDLYVLEKSIASSHPRAEHLVEDLLKGYASAFKQSSSVLKRLEDVRMRGRKRSMIG